MRSFFYHTLFFISVNVVFIACAPKPYVSTNKIYRQKANDLAAMISSVPTNNALDSSQNNSRWIGTVNFGIRKPNFVILHHTAQNSCEQTLQTFTRDSTQVSAHYVICKDGTLHHLLNDYLRGWHAGLGKWGGTTDVNSSSIGIELDNNGYDTFSNAQLLSLEALLAVLKKKYNIPAANFIGHGDIAPGRKTDPGILFPWKHLADSGYGLWYGDTSGIIVPDHFNPVMGLRIIGYDVSKTAAAIQAFRQHFLQSVVTGELSEQEKKVLYALMLKYM